MQRSLPEGAKDSRLEAAVTSAFSKFGCVFVKIRRDGRNMPFAFAQYTASHQHTRHPTKALTRYTAER